MKQFISTLAALLLVMTAAACQKTTEQTETVAQTATVSSSTIAPPAQNASTPAAAPYDLQFLDAMSAHHASAVEMAKMAQSKIQQSRLKELVAKILGDQPKEIDQMKAWRDQWYPGAAKSDNMAMGGRGGRGGSMNMDMSHMKSMKSGAGYDGMFIDMMTPHHEEAVTMAKEALTKAEHPEIKALAQRIIDAQTKEIELMKKVKAGLTRS